MKKTIGLLAIAAVLMAFGFAQPAQAVGTIGGVVLDADGAAVANAQVVVQGVEHRRGQRPYMARANSGEDGSFTFNDVPAGRYIVMAMTRELGGARAETRLEDGGAVRLELVLQGHRGGGGGNEGGEEVQYGSLTGVVLDADGNPVEGARVALAPARLVARRGMRNVRHLNATTDANGAFTIDRLPVGVWVVMAMKREVGAARDRVEIAVDQQAEIELTLRRRQ